MIKDMHDKKNMIKKKIYTTASTNITHFLRDLEN